MQEIFTKLQLQLKSGYPFAVYKKPDSNFVAGIFQKGNAAYYTENFEEQGFVFAPFAGNSYIFIPANKSDIIIAQLRQQSVSQNQVNMHKATEEDKVAFENLVRKAVGEIHKGTFEKVVLSRKEILELSNANITEIFTRLLYLYPAAFVYCFYHPETGLWMGATPEQLLKADNNTIHTVALAGTQLYEVGNNTVWQDKEKHEQQIVAKYIKESIENLAASITATTPYTYRAGNLVHIKTDMSAEIKNSATVKDVIIALHPTPAVCGMPKKEATDFIVANENHNREYYSGFLGEVKYDVVHNKSNATDLFVNLRCMKIEDEAAHIYIGCGITANSNPEKEFIETVNKASTIKSVL